MYNNKVFNIIKSSDMQNCYQLSGGIYIPENADMKSSQYLIPGNYYCNSVNVALTLSNCPFKSAFLLKVEWSVGSNAKYIRQTFIQYDNNRTISRVYFDNEAVWQDETQFITNADLGTGFISSGAFTDIVQDGIYYVSNNVIGKPGNAGGTYILASPYGEATTQCGLYIENLPNGGVYKIIRSGGDQQHIRLDQ